MINGGQTPGSSGVESLNLLTGALELIGGTNITITPSGDTIRIDASGDLSGITSNVQMQIDALNSGQSFRGGYNASSNLFPSINGSGPAGAIQLGDQWSITVEGTLGGVDVRIGANIIALADLPGQTAGNWNINQSGITSVFGRPGPDIIATINDYNISQITNGLSNLLADGNLYVGNVSGVSASVPMSGEASILNTGAVTLSNAAVIAKVLTSYTQSSGALAPGDSVFSALRKLGGTPTIEAIRLNSVTTPIIMGLGGNTVTFDTTFNTGANLVKFPNGSSSTIIPIGSSLGAAVSNIAANGVQNKITIIDQVLFSFSATPGVIDNTDTLVTFANKIVGNLASYAPLASPALTGAPTAPTASQGTSTAQLATTDFVTIGLAAKASTTTLTAGLALKANIASPALTGSPTAPTKSQGDFSTNLATTGYVDIGLANTLAAADLQSAYDVGIGYIQTTSQKHFMIVGNAAGFKPPVMPYANFVALTNNYNGMQAFDDTNLRPIYNIGSDTAQVYRSGAYTSDIAALEIISRCRITWLSTTTIGLGAGSWTAVGGIVRYPQASDVIITPANVGVVNGLDTGTYAANTTYHIYSIAHGTTPALNGGICSTSFAGPTLPSGYVAYRYQGTFRRSTSLGIIRFIQTGTGATRKITYTGINGLTEFGSGLGSTTFVPLSMSSFVPPGARTGRVSFEIGFGATTDTCGIMLRETGSTVAIGSNLISYNGGVIPTGSQVGTIDFVCSASQSIDYALGDPGGPAYLRVLSYEYDL